jgi:hypothetical protein
MVEVMEASIHELNEFFAKQTLRDERSFEPTWQRPGAIALGAFLGFRSRLDRNRWRGLLWE